jgi:regulator of sirC expression with transglutaminase-like and TPR domain
MAGLLAAGLGSAGRSESTARPNATELNSQACLEELDLRQLDQALRRCNAVVQAHRTDPAPLTDRSLLYILLGRINQACRDVDRAMTLMNIKGSTVDPMIRHELKVRQASCRQRISNAGKG